MVYVHVPYTFIVRSDEPLTSLLPWRCKHLTVPECPASVRAAQAVLVRLFHTYMYNKHTYCTCIIKSSDGPPTQLIKITYTHTNSKTGSIAPSQLTIHMHMYSTLSLLW